MAEDSWALHGDPEIEAGRRQLLVGDGHLPRVEDAARADAPLAATAGIGFIEIRISSDRRVCALSANFGSRLEPRIGDDGTVRCLVAGGCYA